MVRRFRKREEIFKKAKEVFSEKGIISTNIEDIAKKLKITRTGIYYYYKSKHEIVIEIIEDGLRRFFDELIKNSKEVRTKRDVFETIFNVFLWMKENDKEFVSIYFQIFSSKCELKLRKYREFFMKKHRMHFDRYKKFVSDRGIKVDDDEYHLLIIFLNGIILTDITGFKFEKFKKFKEFLLEFLVK